MCAIGVEADFRDPIWRRIRAEIDSSRASTLLAYVHGASRDGTLNARHKTLRIFQADVRWLQILYSLLRRLGRRSWIYREGDRRVWVLETTWDAAPLDLPTPEERRAFVRGYFDAEGGVPRCGKDRFHIQFVQKDFDDLDRARQLLEAFGIRCGRMHNPTAEADPESWRFYVLDVSHQDFVRTIGSWHPRKRAIFESRFSWLDLR